jgi:hypothetical protein
MVEPLVDIVMGVAEIVCLFTGRTVLTALSLGRIKPERFWGRSQSGRFGFSRMPDGTIIVDDFWTTLCGFAVWAMVVCLGLLLHSQRP